MSKEHERRNEVNAGASHEEGRVECVSGSAERPHRTRAGVIFCFARWVVESDWSSVGQQVGMQKT